LWRAPSLLRFNSAAAFGVAQAQSPDSSPQGGALEEVIVTAQFRRQNLQETPLAITAVSGDMLEARSQTSIAEVANQAPSVTLKANSAAYGPSLAANIRGVGQFDFHPALEPGVGIYVDDVYYSTLTGSILDLLDLERVELLRGPQGTLAGKNSIGGAVKLYSRRPTGEGPGYVSATYGSADRVGVRASGEFALSNKLFARVSGVSKTQDGYVDVLDYGCVNPGSGIPSVRPAGNCLVSKQGGVDYQAVRGQLRFVPGDALEVNLIGDFTRDDRPIAGTVLTYANYTGPGDINPFTTPRAFDSRFLCGRFCNYSTYGSPADGPFQESRIPGRVDFEGWGVSGQVDWQPSDTLQLVSITAYRDYTSIFSNEDDLSPMTHSLGGPNTLDFHAFSQELRLNGSLGTNTIEYTVGGFYMDQKAFYSAAQDLRYVPAGWSSSAATRCRRTKRRSCTPPGMPPTAWPDGRVRIRGRQGLHLCAAQSGWPAACRKSRAAEWRYRQLPGRDHRLSRECAISMGRGPDDLCAVFDRLQGRWHQPAAVRSGAGAALRP
jgi:iron complex outermembrane receptor protein